MRTLIRLSLVALMLAVFTVTVFTQPVMAGDTAKLDRAVDKALKKLYASSPAAMDLSKTAKAVLVFPKIMKVGLIFGGQYGEGALRMDGKTADYYNTISASYGLQAGAQKFGYALFFMDAASLEYLNNSAGWEIGVGPSVVFVDEGMARTMTTTTAREGIYAFTFGQKGLMAGIGIQGSKITRITPK
ncbi:MAG: twin-arginine translocation pathway signal protein [Deltaproteobacteria bacterium]|nr:twin-arginine translocation pathway signal protein [Deltaproteobacteria bacterium]